MDLAPRQHRNNIILYYLFSGATTIIIIILHLGCCHVTRSSGVTINNNISLYGDAHREAIGPISGLSITPRVRIAQSRCSGLAVYRGVRVRDATTTTAAFREDGVFERSYKYYAYFRLIFLRNGRIDTRLFLWTLLGFEDKKRGGLYFFQKKCI